MKKNNFPKIYLVAPAINVRDSNFYYLSEYWVFDSYDEALNFVKSQNVYLHLYISVLTFNVYLKKYQESRSYRYSCTCSNLFDSRLYCTEWAIINLENFEKKCLTLV